MSDSAFSFTSQPSIDEPFAPDEVEPDLEPEAPKREPRMGVYVLESGDNPSIVAGKLFDRRSRGRELVLANPDVDWVEGAEIQIPQDES